MKLSKENRTAVICGGKGTDWIIKKCLNQGTNAYSENS